jgi:hypothetical protein
MILMVRYTFQLQTYFIETLKFYTLDRHTEKSLVKITILQYREVATYCHLVENSIFNTGAEVNYLPQETFFGPVKRG